VIRSDGDTVRPIAAIEVPPATFLLIELFRTFGHGLLRLQDEWMRVRGEREREGEREGERGRERERERERREGEREREERR
jgi:hypothetical protein